MTRSWRRLAEALGPGMIDLRVFKDMDRQQGRPDQMPGGSGFFGRMDADDDEPHPPTRPGMQLARPEDGDVDPNDSILGMFAMGDDKDDGEKDESAFSQLSHKLAKEPGVTNPDALAASIGRKKYGAAGMAAKSAAGRKH